MNASPQIYLAAAGVTWFTPSLRMGRAVVRLMLAVIMSLASGVTLAAEAARVFHAEGEVRIDARTAVVGDAVQEGAHITTGANGYVYMKTVDDGLFILRPNSAARIVRYHIDDRHPENTRIKLELSKGIARSQSGKAVKAARQNFRFNTPVAAIGVRGTDFTVFTDAETSRVSVLSGAIVISGFGRNCNPAGAGPCEGGSSRELMASQVGQLLQVRRGQPAPQLLNGGSLTPDVVAPPKVEEPAVKVSSAANGAVSGAVGAPSAAVAAALAGTVGGDVNLDAQKSANLLQKIPAVVDGGLPPVVVTPPAVVIAPAPTPELRHVIWGRYTAMASQAPNVDIRQQTANHAQLVALSGAFAVMRSAGSDWAVPDHGTAVFILRQGEAYVRDEARNISTAATVTNGKLSLDFGKSSFATNFDLVVSATERHALQATGSVSPNGTLLGVGQFAAPSNMAVSGALGPENGGTAAYVFASRLDSRRVANGITYWTK